MSRLALVERTKLNLADVTIVLSGGSSLEVEVLIQLFTGFGARQIRRGESTAELRKVIESELVDLVVADAVGGLTEILDVVRDMRRMTGQSRYAPTVLTTSNVVPSMLKMAREGGVNYVVAKPISPRTLFERLVWIVKDSRPFIEAETYVGPDRRVRSFGPPPGTRGRRAGDLPPEVGIASTPNLSQADIDAMMSFPKKAR